MHKHTKIGVLGGGQLGKMLIQEGINFPIEFHVLDPDKDCPCSEICKNFSCGSFNDFESVVNFGKVLDVVTIEIENVNTAALFELKKLGVKVFPEPHVIELIKDKGLQKDFYAKNNFRSSEFVYIENPSEELNSPFEFPFFLKMRTGGYDGKGVKKIYNQKDLNNSYKVASIAEKDIKPIKELAVIVARNSIGEIKSFPSVESIFVPEIHLVDYLNCPANISKSKELEAQQIAKSIIEALEMTGILAVEFFIDNNENIWINEIAPRPHNSGHQSIEANTTSQYEQLVRCLLSLPLGETDILFNSAMVNLLGHENYQGDVAYQGLEKVLSQKNVFLHLYGKKTTKPYRKMGHVTIVGNSKDEISEKVEFIKANLKVFSIKKVEN
jgi:5-(carboxyamino)imidazole ribonucleotide synthase